MSSQTDRNPTPPPEILEQDEDFVPDRIGNSMYSKRWLYKTLMNILKVVEECADVDGKPTEENTLAPEGVNPISQDIVELDRKIEEDACTLWDMSANREVAEFLSECNVSEIFLNVIEHTRSPRLLEIVVGILGNMSSFRSTCEYISRSDALVSSIVALSGCIDSCTLVQLFRLLHCGIARVTCQKKWFDAFDENSDFMENLKSILENNLCTDVLKGLLEFLDRILNDHSKYCTMWSEESYILAIIESGKQLLKCNHFEDLDSFFSVLNTLYQHCTDTAAYAKYFEALRPLFHGYFLKLGEEETLPQLVRINVISCVFAMYGNLLLSESIHPEFVILENDMFKAMLNVCKLVKSLLLNLRNSREGQQFANKESRNTADSITKTEERNGDASEKTVDDDMQNWETLLEAIVYAAKACCSHTQEVHDIQILEEIIKLNELESIGTAGT